MPKCRNCGKKSDNLRQFGLSKYCDYKCAAEFANKPKQIEKGRTIQRKEQKKKDREWLQANKPMRKLTDEAQAAVNKYIRIRDYGKPCISCGAPYRTGEGGKFSYFDAGHYRSRGAAKHLRFNLFNIAGQCVACNRYKSGNAVDFRIGLIKRIGLKRVESLENNNETRKFTVEYLERIKKIFNKRARLYEKRR